MQTIHDKLASQESVPVLYRKADGSIKSYLLTLKNKPSYEAKTDRVKVETPAHLINAFDLTQGKFVSLKIDSIVSF